MWKLPEKYASHSNLQNNFLDHRLLSEQLFARRGYMRAGTSSLKGVCGRLFESPDQLSEGDFSGDFQS
jgi:hypothetical protein